MIVVFDAYCGIDNPKFTLTTTTLEQGDEFYFGINASGTFYVDCGVGGELLYTTNDVTGPVNGVYTITHSTVKIGQYRCSYSSGGKKTIKFDGLATGYDTSPSPGTIHFAYREGWNDGTWVDDNTLLETVTGDMSAVFPTLDTPVLSLEASTPSFFGTFARCINLTEIPGTLFSHATKARQAMFEWTFYSCKSLEEIPSGLFSNLEITSPAGAVDLFEFTFNDCISLTDIPSGLFSSVTEGGDHMFADTFNGCTSLENIPTDLFDFNGNVPGESHMFAGTFMNCENLEEIPSGLFSHVYGGADNLFWDTFYGCTSLETIPDNLFSTITNGADSMFYQTFFGCTNLTSIPPHLFSNVETDAINMFLYTFTGDVNLTGYIPPTLFAKLTPRQSSYSEYTINDTFYWTGDFAKTCPAGTEQYTTGYESYWSASDGQARKSCVPLNFSVIYHSGNCVPSDVNNQYGNTYSQTDPTQVPFGSGYTVLSPADSNLFGEDYPTDWGMLPSCSSFFGWKNPNISGTDYDYSSCYDSGGCSPQISSYNYVENLNLYAYCSWNQYTVQYTGCDGTVTSATLQYGDSFLTPTYSYYTFNGWLYNGQPVGVTFPESLCIKGAQTLNLTANCTPNVYTITYHDVTNLGATWVNNQQPPYSYTYGTGATIGVPSRTNHVFRGWCVNNPNCADYATNIGGYIISTTATGDFHLYAKWDSATVNLSWVSNGQSYQNQQSCSYNVDTIQNITHGTRTGYTFVGWKITDWCPFVDSVCGLDGTAVNNLTYNNDLDTLGYYGHVQTVSNMRNTSLYNLSPGEWAVKDTNGGLLKGVSSCNSTKTTIWDTAMTDFYVNQTITEQQFLDMVWGTCNTDTLKSSDTFTATASGQGDDLYCWCKMTSYTPSGAATCNVESHEWMLSIDEGTAAYCAQHCAIDCAIHAKQFDIFRRAIFGVLP